MAVVDNLKIKNIGQLILWPLLIIFFFFTKVLWLEAFVLVFLGTRKKYSVASLLLLFVISIIDLAKFYSYAFSIDFGANFILIISGLSFLLSQKKLKSPYDLLFLFFHIEMALNNSLFNIQTAWIVGINLVFGIFYILKRKEISITTVALAPLLSLIFFKSFFTPLSFLLLGLIFLKNFKVREIKLNGKAGKLVNNAEVPLLYLLFLVFLWSLPKELFVAEIKVFSVSIIMLYLSFFITFRKKKYVTDVFSTGLAFLGVLFFLGQYA